MSEFFVNLFKSFKDNLKLVLLSVLSIVIVSLSISFGAYHVVAYTKTNDLEGLWQVELYKSSYKFHFTDQSLLITTESTQEGLTVQYNLKMDYMKKRNGRGYILETSNHSVSSNIQIDEAVVFSNYPREYVDRLTQDEKNQYLNQLQDKMESYRLGEFYQKAIQNNPTLQYFLKNNKQTLVIGTFLNTEQSLSLEKVK